jgi:membrane-associated phospholipid phosphatase
LEELVPAAAVDTHNPGLSMSALEHVIHLLMAIILIVGGYQFYFLVQRRHLGEPIEFPSKIDDRIPFRPEWVWIYSGLYYPVILVLVFTIKTFAQFSYTVFSFITLLIMQLAAFFFFPVKIPQHWREYDRDQSLSARFLGLVHSYDGLPNSIPSMHVSVSTLAAFHLQQNLLAETGMYSLLAFLFPLLIAISALFTKQHYIVDLAPGAFLGYVNFEIYLLLRP